jgi:hypothetical protein
VPKSAMPVPCRALIPDVLPAVMPDLPAVPDVLPAPPPELVLPSRLPADLPAEGALRWPRPWTARCRPGSGRSEGNWYAKRCLPAGMMKRSQGCAGSCARSMTAAGGGAVPTLEYLLALPLIAGMAGDGELDAAAEWAAAVRGEPAAPVRRGRRLAWRSVAGEAWTVDRGHGRIDVRTHHYVRDVVFGEDASRIGRAHRATAAVRNTIAGILHLHRVPNIAAQLRACHPDPYQLPLQLLGLMTPLAPNGNPAVT